MVTFGNKPNPEKIIRTLVECWCDQYDQKLISLEITKKEEVQKDEKN